MTMQPTRTAEQYAEMTDLQLAADLERWANVRDGINTRTPADRPRPKGALASLNLREAARRLRGSNAPSTGVDITASTLAREQMSDAMDHWNEDLTDPDYYDRRQGAGL